MSCYFNCLFAVCVCSALCAAGAASEDGPVIDPGTKQLNERMSRRAELMVTAHKLDAEIQRAWMDEANTSPEIAKLRARYLELQEELRKTQRAIQAKVEELPAVVEKKKKRDDARAEERALSKTLGEEIGK